MVDSEKGGEKLALSTSRSDNTSELDGSSAPAVTQTVRGLAPRHVQLMAIAGSIGTGLWVTTVHDLGRFPAPFC